MNNRSSDISIYESADTGSLAPVGTVLAVGGARSVSVHPSGRFAYVAKDDNSVSVFTIDAETGMLRTTAHATTADGPGKVRFHPSGSFAYVPEYGSNSVSVFTVDTESGALAAAAPLGLSPLVVLQDISIDPSGKFVYVTTSDGNVSSYAIDSGTGLLQLRSSVATGAFPRAITVAPLGDFLCVDRGNFISTHTIDAGGVLGPQNVVDASNVVSVAIEPTGRFLYAAGASGGVVADISVYSIGAAGALTLEQVTPSSGGLERVLAVRPSGRFVYMTRLDNDTVHVFEIHQETGELTKMAMSFESGSEPVDVSVVDIVQ